jgi:hypothetical protein
MRRYYALLLGTDGMARLVRELDGATTLDEAPFARRDYAEPHEIALRVEGSELQASIDGVLFLQARDGALAGGAVAFVCEEGCLTCDALRVRPPC